MITITHGISVESLDTAHRYESNSRALFETMSGIKSVIGTLAIENAYNRADDLDDTQLTITDQHCSNGSSDYVRPLLAASRDDSVQMSLRDIITHSTAESDCIATNRLIDYLDGAQQINQQIKNRLELPSLQLVTDSINFPGVDHELQPFQVAKGAMIDFVRYYKALWASDNDYQFQSGEHLWHQTQHEKVSKARLLGVRQSELPKGVQWFHKTGSGHDYNPIRQYSTAMDAGLLIVDGRRYVVAAAITADGKRIDKRPDQWLEQEFAIKNSRGLAEVGLTIQLHRRRARHFILPKTA